VYAATVRELQVFVVLGSGLLFMLQPLVGRLLLPSHGGSFQVWTTCLLFFQLALLAGYAYAHLALPRLGHRHRILLLASLPCAWLALDRIPARAGSIAAILTSLLLGVGLPFIVLATTSLVAQLRAVTLPATGARDPYSLYAYSNLGSLLGLISYPFALEPWLGVSAQRALWATLYVVYLVMAWRLTPSAAARHHSAPVSPNPRSRLLYWIALSASACAVLLGLTNVVSLGAGSIPLLWVLTLAAYLLGFIAAFSARSTRIAPSWLLPEVVLFALIVYVDPRPLRGIVPESYLLVLQLFCLFWTTWSACAELQRTRPEPTGLTVFYLAIAFGGALAGVSVSLIAPLVLRDLYEYPVALLALAGTLTWGRRSELRRWLSSRSSWAQGERLHAGRFVRAAALLALAGWLASQYARDPRPSAALRNYYGLYAIWDYDRGRDSDGIERSVRLLSHNGTNHGFESRRPDERCLPTGYFHRLSPLGELLTASAAPRRAAVIGLGAGTIAAYFSARDDLTFYELDPDTLGLAHKYFDYLDGCSARPRIVTGDARVELGRDAALHDHSIDVLIVDAFSGDSIPCHLLTREAQTLYLRKLAPHGLLIFHVSSRFYELWPTIASTARSLGVASVQRTRLEGRALGPLAWSSQYLVASRDRAYLDALASRGWLPTTRDKVAPWTDDRASLLWPLLQRLAGP
jgi:hypothetical protein